MKKIIVYEYNNHDFLHEIKNIVSEVISEQVDKIYSASNSPPLNEKLEVLSSKQVCEMLHISAPTLINYRKIGKLKGKRVKGKIFYLKTDIQNFLKTSKN